MQTIILLYANMLSHASNHTFHMINNHALCCCMHQLMFSITGAWLGGKQFAQDTNAFQAAAITRAEYATVLCVYVYVCVYVCMCVVFFSIAELDYNRVRICLLFH